MKKALRYLPVLLLLSFAIAGYVFWSMGNAGSWESSIRKFEAEDRVHPPKLGAILFVGSSSINFWDTLARDMVPLDVINRGFGGSQLADVNQFADRIVLPYRPRAIVLYAGDNDLSWPWSKSPQTVLNDFKRFVAIVHGGLPETWIYYISIKPCPARWGNWATVQQTNRMIAEFANGQERVQFIDVTPPMLDAHGKVRSELFRSDGLHLNSRGYALWTSIIKPILLQRFPAEENAGIVQEVKPSESSVNGAIRVFDPFPIIPFASAKRFADQVLSLTFCYLMVHSVPGRTLELVVLRTSSYSGN